jgi:hypothetical protein
VKISFAWLFIETNQKKMEPHLLEHGCQVPYKWVPGWGKLFGIFQESFYTGL